MSNPYDNTRDKNSSVLGPTLKFKGVLTADEDLLIQGRIEGSIKHTSSLTIGESGHIKADVKAEYIAVEGHVNGDLIGSKSVKVRETAKITGNIVSPNVSLVEGAKFNGTIDMDGDSINKSAAKPEKAATPAKTDDQGNEVVATEDGPVAKQAPAAKKPNRTVKKSADAA